MYSVSGDYELAARLAMARIEAAYVNEPVVRFRVGDFSFQSPARLVCDMYRIQRGVLGQGLAVCVVSAIRRIVSIGGTYAIHSLPRVRKK